MKRILCLLLTALMLLSLFSCSKAPAESAATEENAPEKTTEDVLPSFSTEPVGVAIKSNPYPDLDLNGMTEVQKAVVTTAESFFLRGSRAQYEDTRFLNTSKLLYYRWAVQQRLLEEYTSQNIGFLQCAAFCYEVYRNALDLDLIYEDKVCYYTSRFDSNANHVLRETPVASGFSNMTSEQLEQKKQEFISALQPGDIIVYRVKTNGHAMLYVGNNTIIHSGGSVYNWDNKTEVYEENGTVRKDSIDFFFEKGQTRYLFNKQSYCIIRPIVDFNVTEIPQKSLSRMGEMRGVLAEKLASHTAGQTVSPGEEIAFTFSLENMTKENKSLTVTDTLPLYTEFVKGDFTLTENALNAKVELPAGAKKEVSYTVRVAIDAPLGTLIESESFVSDIPTNCPEITVGKTLSSEEQEKLVKAITSLDEKKLTGIPLANAIYEKALGRKALSETDGAVILEDLFRLYSDALENKTAESDANFPWYWRTLDPSSSYLSMIAPNLYGGRYVAENTSSSPLTDLEWFQNKRARYVSSNQLIPGDLIFTSISSKDLKTSVYLFTGDALLDLQNRNLMPADLLLSRLVSDR
ncbi:MAG: C40 family peptidase, partial [Clostridia bacterium]|nr:C40 family peptidase [Clostridia bacterium]